MKLSTFVCLTGVSVLSTSPAFSQEMSPMEWGIDRPGSDISGGQFDTARGDPSLCQNQCAASIGCAAWSYVPATLRCFLKNGVPEAVVRDDVVSGVKSAAFIR
jgi:hypothetical protein